MGVEMNNLTLQTQAQIAGGVALLCLVFGAAAWEIATGHRKWLGRATIAGGVLQLMAFSHHAVGQYQVVLATTQIPLIEVASSDNGRERTVERIDTSDGIRIEREHIAGWRLVSAAGRGRAADWRLPSGDAGDQGCCGGNEGSEGEVRGCVCGILGVPGCCEEDCRDCACGSISHAVSGIRF